MISVTFDIEIDETDSQDVPLMDTYERDMMLERQH